MKGKPPVGSNGGRDGTRTCGVNRHPCAHGVKLGIGQRHPQVRSVERAGVETALPHVARGRAASVEIGGVTAVGVLQGKAQGVVALGSSDQVHMVGHEAITEQAEAVHRAVAAQEVEVDEPVGIGLQNELAGVAPLVMWCGVSTATTRASRAMIWVSGRAEQMISGKTFRPRFTPGGEVWPPPFPRR